MYMMQRKRGDFFKTHVRLLEMRQEKPTGSRKFVVG